MSTEISTFKEFWPYYLKEHSLPITRAWHYVGTSLAILIFIAAVSTSNWIWILGALICGYFFAWVSHGLFQKNKPATFTYPAWSLMSDFKMLFCFLTGRMKRELQMAGIDTNLIANKDS